MRCALLLLITILKIISLRTKPIHLLAQRNGPVDLMLPFGPSKISNEMLHHAGNYIENNNEENEWNDADFKFQQNDIISKKIVNHENIEESGELPDDQFKSIEQLNDLQSARLSDYLMKLFERPEVWKSRLFLVKDSLKGVVNKPSPTELDGSQDTVKRSRYYRRYPWKRQNSRSYNNIDYDPYNPCNPTRHDVFQLLVALHDARQGNKTRFINFCNRRRPASAIYTNIRFLGRRRK